MNGIYVDYTRSQLGGAGSEFEARIMPNDRSHIGRRGVIFCHGYKSDVRGATDPIGSPGPAKIIRLLALAGIACVSADLGLNTFGNDLSMTRIGQARAYLAAQGVATDKVLFVADSMGNWLATRYAMDNPGQVAGILALEPGIDLSGVRDGNILSAQADINTAWGLAAGSTSGTVPIPARANLLARAAAGELAGLPYRAYYSTADAVALPAHVTALVTSIGATAEAIAVPGGLPHGAALTAAVPHADAAAWIAAAA